MGGGRRPTERLPQARAIATPDPRPTKSSKARAQVLTGQNLGLETPSCRERMRKPGRRRLSRPSDRTLLGAAVGGCWLIAARSVIFVENPR